MKYPELIKFIRVNKIIILFLSCLFFTLLYTLIDDNHFKGLNQVKDITKDEIIKKEVEIDVEEVSKENFDNYDNYISKEMEKEKNIDESTKTTKKEVEQQELDPSQIKPNIIQKIFNRLYFSISTGCLVGYGDIYPITNTSKTLSIMQSLLTVSLILA
jgi:hypothetical protein